jgi:CheY-like chemotaxis protein/phosphoribosyl 1,2-cyclic phosphodiesterase
MTNPPDLFNSLDTAPALGASAAAADIEADARAVAGGRAVTGAQRVLVVDDTREIRDLMQTILQTAGYETRVLDGAGELEATLEAWPPDLILCDVLMPGRDGLAVLADLQANPRTRHIPVVLVTAKGFPGDQHAALTAGVAGYFIKPFEVGALLDTVSAVLSSEAGVRVWGCRGAIAAPEHAGGRFGGNTSCVELVLPAHATQGRRRIIFDAGTGIRALGNSIFESPVRATLCLTHFHWDHIQGLPFFKPLYQAGNQITLFGPASSDSALHETIREQMGGAFFPISTEAFSSSVEYIGLQEQEFEIDGLRCATFSAMHPGFTLAYKVHYNNKTFVYCPDNEVSPRFVERDAQGRVTLSGEPARLAQWLDGTDVLLHDCQYSVAQYESHRGWGHSPAHTVAALAVCARVKQVVLFHHDPDHPDDVVSAIHDEFRAALEEMAPEQAPLIRSQIAGEGAFISL